MTDTRVSTSSIDWPESPTFEVVDDSTQFTESAWTFEATAHLGGGSPHRIVRVDIHRHDDPERSTAHVAVLSPTMVWSVLARVPVNEWHAGAFDSTPQLAPEIRVVCEELAMQLFTRAATILNVPLGF